MFKILSFFQVFETSKPRFFEPIIQLWKRPGWRFRKIVPTIYRQPDSVLIDEGPEVVDGAGEWSLGDDKLVSSRVRVD